MNRTVHIVDCCNKQFRDELLCGVHRKIEKLILIIIIINVFFFINKSKNEKLPTADIVFIDSFRDTLGKNDFGQQNSRFHFDIIISTLQIWTILNSKLITDFDLHIHINEVECVPNMLIWHRKHSTNIFFIKCHFSDFFFTILEMKIFRMNKETVRETEKKKSPTKRMLKRFDEMDNNEKVLCFNRKQTSISSIWVNSEQTTF